MTVEAIFRLIQFEQHFCQGLWKDSDPLEMLPCTTKDTIKPLKRAMKGKGTIQNLQEMSVEDRKALGIWGEPELAQVNHALKTI